MALTLLASQTGFSECGATLHRSCSNGHTPPATREVCWLQPEAQSGGWLTFGGERNRVRHAQNMIPKPTLPELQRTFEQLDRFAQRLIQPRRVLDAAATASPFSLFPVRFELRRLLFNE